MRIQTVASIVLATSIICAGISEAATGADPKFPEWVEWKASPHHSGRRAEPVELVLRGRSRSPLYVTAVGMDVAEAASHIRVMHGPFRIPTLLKRADQLSRCVACGELG